VRDYESTTYVSNMGPLEEFGPLLRQEAIRRGLGQAQKVVLLVDGAEGLEHMGRLNFKDAIQIVDFYHGAHHAGDVVAALLGSKEHPEYQARRCRWVRRLLGNGVKNLIEETARNAPVSRRLSRFTRTWAISCTISNGCNTGPFVGKACLLVPGSLRPAARP
jgi:hypothetical protein